jgi:hypothetical protein
MTRLIEAFPTDARKIICLFNKEAERDTSQLHSQNNEIPISYPLHYHARTYICHLEISSLCSFHNSEIKITPVLITMQHNERQRIQTNDEGHTAEALFLEVGSQMRGGQVHPSTTR